MITEVTIYEKNAKMYCEACKPKGGERGTLMTSAYGRYCAGCGEDLKEIGEVASWRQQAWDALQSVPAYVERRTS